jgi:hypothetical protein
MMTKMPVAGVVWQTVHYLVGFQRLGYDVFYVEAHARTPSMFMSSESCDGSGKAAAFIDSVMTRFDLAGRWAFHALHEPHAPLYGMSDTELRDLYRNADLIINLHGGTEPRPEHYQSGRLVYLETDPVALQIELHDNNADTIRFLEPHCAFFTFGENLGNPDCGLPVSDRFPFKPTRQPVVPDFWEHALPAGDAFTTIGNWEQRWRQVTFNGQTYHWSKHLEFRKVIDLPSVTTQPFELALASYDDATREMLESNGWRVRHAMGFSTDTDAYRDYIQRSRGEFTVAKDQNVRLRSGWFSDRSATYLAAGRPVITQDTGFGNVLPTGKGLIAFATLEDAAAAVEAVVADFPAHCRAASDIARNRFAAGEVLGRLLGEVSV